MNSKANDVIAVIQCASKKRAGAGHLVTSDNLPINFVADPEASPKGRVYKRPDDVNEDGVPWRTLLQKYNTDHSGDNPLHLCPAFQLYDNNVYVRLVERLGVSNVYVLSAGWGLISADFLTPFYDITFSSGVEGYKRRRKGDRYQDFCMLPATKRKIIFFGSKAYLPLFCSLTVSIHTEKIVFYNSQIPPPCEDCKLERFVGSRNTNWQYDCANAFIDGRISI